MPRNQNNRGGSRRGNNNNPEGKNQYTSGMFGAARERPATTAMAAAGAVAAGVFLWSKRAQISDQLSQLSDQIGEWTDQMGSDRSSELETVGGDSQFSSATRRNRGTSRTTGTGGTTGSVRKSGSSSSNPVNPVTGVDPIA